MYLYSFVCLFICKHRPVYLCCLRLKLEVFCVGGFAILLKVVLQNQKHTLVHHVRSVFRMDF